MAERPLAVGERAQLRRLNHPGTTVIRLLNGYEALEARVEQLEEGVLYLAGYDVAGWEGHMRPDEVLAKLGVSPTTQERDASR